VHRFLKLIAKTVAGLFLLVAVILAGFRLTAYFRETMPPESLVPANGRFVSTSFGKIHVSIWGNDQDPAVLMTHGMAAWGQLWRDVAEDLVAKGYRVIALDQAPFGLSDNENRDYFQKCSSRAVEANA
jgi:hypothetical protein